MAQQQEALADFRRFVAFRHNVKRALLGDT
jgi:hypothetical protein